MARRRETGGMWGSPEGRNRRLPGGYRLEEEPGVLLLRRADGTPVAYFCTERDVREVVAEIAEKIVKDGLRECG